ncbi:MAG: hypothetical protein FK730_14365 [Asgard group archaeon]|nr:hypothetical protein [Asgard group archaeon]
MIETAIIFSKEIKDLVLTSTYGDIDPIDESFADYLEKIKEIAFKLEKGLFSLDLDKNLFAVIHAFRRLSIVFVFNQVLDKNMINAWEKVSKEINNDFDKIFDPRNLDNEKYKDYKETLDKIIDWQLKEESPIDKMKDALW